MIYDYMRELADEKRQHARYQTTTSGGSRAGDYKVVGAGVTTDAAIDILKEFPELETLVLGGSVTDEGLARLKDSHQLYLLRLDDARTLTCRVLSLMV